LEASVRKSPRFHQKQPKTLKTYLPQPQVVRIQQRHVAGQKNSEIARAENCDRHTVARIIKAPEMATYIGEMRARFNGFAPLALDAVEHGLTIAKDAKLAIEVLKDIGVIEPRENKVPVETEEEREARLEVEWTGRMAMMAFEKNEIYGTDLGPDLERLKSQLELKRTNNKSETEEEDDHDDDDDDDEDDDDEDEDEDEDDEGAAPPESFAASCCIPAIIAWVIAPPMSPDIASLAIWRSMASLLEPLSE
jgi:hypothetical protein